MLLLFTEFSICSFVVLSEQMKPNAIGVPSFTSSAHQMRFGSQLVGNRTLMEKVKLHFVPPGGRQKAKTVMISDRKNRV
jgi:hypothetical protein